MNMWKVFAVCIILICMALCVIADQRRLFSKRSGSQEAARSALGLASTAVIAKCLAAEMKIA